MAGGGVQLGMDFIATNKPVDPTAQKREIMRKRANNQGAFLSSAELMTRSQLSPAVVSVRLPGYATLTFANKSL